MGPFHMVGGDGGCLDLLHLGWGALCTVLCEVDRDEVLRARSGLLHVEEVWEVERVGFRLHSRAPHRYAILAARGGAVASV